MQNIQVNVCKKYFGVIQLHICILCRRILTAHDSDSCLLESLGFFPCKTDLKDKIKHFLSTRFICRIIVQDTFLNPQIPGACYVFLYKTKKMIFKLVN